MPGKRNRDDKIDKLINAVGTTLQEQGPHGLGVNKIAARAGVSKPMVYEYFGSFTGLLKAYITSKDPWIPYFHSLNLPMRASVETREREGIRLLNMVEGHFHNSGVSLRSVMAFLVGGIYYNVLHTSADAGTIAGVSLKNKEEFNQMRKTLAQVIDWAFQAAEAAKS